MITTSGFDGNIRWRFHPTTSVIMLHVTRFVAAALLLAGAASSLKGCDKRYPPVSKPEDYAAKLAADLLRKMEDQTTDLQKLLPVGDIALDVSTTLNAVPLKGKLLYTNGKVVAPSVTIVDDPSSIEVLTSYSSIRLSAGFTVKDIAVVYALKVTLDNFPRPLEAIVSMKVSNLLRITIEDDYADGLISSQALDTNVQVSAAQFVPSDQYVDAVLKSTQNAFNQKLTEIVDQWRMKGWDPLLTDIVKNTKFPADCGQNTLKPRQATWFHYHP